MTRGLLAGQTDGQWLVLNLFLTQKDRPALDWISQHAAALDRPIAALIGGCERVKLHFLGDSGSLDELQSHCSLVERLLYAISAVSEVEIMFDIRPTNEAPDILARARIIKTSLVPALLQLPGLVNPRFAGEASVLYEDIRLPGGTYLSVGHGHWTGLAITNPSLPAALRGLMRVWGGRCAPSSCTTRRIASA